MHSRDILNVVLSHKASSYLQETDGLWCTAKTCRTHDKRQEREPNVAENDLIIRTQTSQQTKQNTCSHNYKR